ncbi:MAG: hypothetical protein HYV32_03135 [Candidatus Kerfeldbacteria bacterium]|nr:hypothetical protein [Candidatus Kerfeldbacteria bacterium]
MKEVFLLGNRSILAFIASVFLCISALPQTVIAAWNPPSCNPDVDPTAPSCLVAAPLNVADVEQTKLGILNIQNTLRAGQLELSTILGGDGSLVLDTNAAYGIDLHYSGTGVALYVESNNGNGLHVISPATGMTVDALQGLDLYGEDWGIHALSNNYAAGVFTSQTVGAALEVENTGAGEGIAISIDDIDVDAITDPGGWTTSTGEALIAASAGTYGILGYSSNTSAQSAGIYGKGESGNGVVAESSNNYALYANAISAAYYGAALCNQGAVNCAYFGGSNYSGLFHGLLYVSASGGGSQSAVAYIENTSTSDTLGYGVRVHVLNGLTVQNAADGTAIDAETYQGNGVFAYSETDPAIYASSSTDNAIYATSTSGTVISAVAPGSNTALSASSVSGTAAAFSTSASTQPTLSLSSVSGTGVSIDVTGGASRRAIDIIQPATIENHGVFLGGQFYANENSENGVYGSTGFHLDRRISVASSPKFALYDGSELWLAFTDTSKIMRMNPLTNYTATVSTTIAARTMILANSTVYAFGTGSKFQTFPVATTPSTVGTLSVGDIDFATYDGADTIWLGRTSPARVSKFSISSSTATTVYDNSSGTLSALLYKDGVVWTVVNGDLLQLTPSGSAVTTATVLIDDITSNIVYDGRFLWFAISDGSLVRYDLADSRTTFFLSIASAIADVPQFLVFDGSKIWIGQSPSGNSGTSSIQAYSIANDALTGEYFSSSGKLYGLIYDGSYFWLPTADVSASSYEILKMYSGSGFGQYGAPRATTGILMYAASATDPRTLYCVYISSAGVLKTSTDLTQCR